MTEIVIRAMEPSDGDALHEIMSRLGVVANTLQLPGR